MRMQKTIWFDMDGTLYDLYGMYNWLDLLECGQYAQAFGAGRPLYDLQHLRRILHGLRFAGWTVGVITWAPMGLEEESADFFNVYQAKFDWIKANLPELAPLFHCIPYGKSKLDFLIESGMLEHINYLIDDNAEVRRDWEKFHSKSAYTLTIDASENWLRAVEGLIG